MSGSETLSRSRSLADYTSISENLSSRKPQDRQSCYHCRAPVEIGPASSMRGCHRKEARRYGLQGRRSRGCQREVVGGRSSAAVETAAGTLRDLRVADGHEAGRRKSRRISHPRVAVVQIRGVSSKASVIHALSRGRVSSARGRQTAPSSKWPCEPFRYR